MGGTHRVAWANTKIIERTWNAPHLPFTAGIGILSSRGMGQLDLAIADDSRARRCYVMP